MPSERIQRQIEALLDDVESAARSLDGSRVRELADGVTIVAPEPGETLPLGGAEGD